MAVDQNVTEPCVYMFRTTRRNTPTSAPSGCSSRWAARAAWSTCAAPPALGRQRPRPGFKRALAEYPDVNVAQEVFTGWQQDQGKQQILDFIATGIPFDGIWTSGIDNVIVDALMESDAPLVPVVGADNAGFVGQLTSVEGLKGAAVTNPGSIGGAGVALALQILDGKAPAEQTVLVTPSLWENVTDDGKAQLKAAAEPVALDPEWPVSISIPDWTTYTKEQIIACKGPGE